MVQAERSAPTFTLLAPYFDGQGGFEHVDRRSPIDIIRSGEVLTRGEIIPLAKINTKTPIIDEHHATDMALAIKNDPRGQLSPILVRIREEEDGEIVYDIADGFHRTSGLKAAEYQETIKATVMYACTDAELADQRIIAANSVKSVKFSRIALWMNEGYELTPWCEMGVKLIDAVNTTVFNSIEVKGAELNSGEIKDMKQWVKEKARHWQTPLSSLWTNLSIIEQSDPRLVRLVRPKLTKGEEGQYITQSHLKAVSDTYPGPENYSIQRALIDWTLTNKATTQQILELTDRLFGKVKIGMKAVKVQEIIKGLEMQDSEVEMQAQLREERFDYTNPKSTNPDSSHSPLKRESSGLKWWKQADGLTQLEQDVTFALFESRKSVASVGEDQGVTREEIGSIILDALDKRQL